MAISAQSILKRVVDQLADVSSVRWTVQELVRYLNDGQREIVTYRPDSTATTASVALAAGARQTLPSGAYKMLDVIRNTGGTKAAIRKIDMKLLDAQVPSWQNSTASATVKHYMYDVRDVLVFYVYPPATDTASIEMLYSAKPTDIAEQSSLNSVTGNITVYELFANALCDYVLFRAFAKDAEYGGNLEKAQAHFAAFQNGVGVEASATAVATPKK